MTKAKAKIQPAAQPVPAAPAVVTLAPNGNAIVNEAPAEDPKNADAPATPPAAEKEHPHQEQIDTCRQALRSFPTLPEGYVCAKGIYFVKELAEKALAEGEELIIVTPENN